MGRPTASTRQPFQFQWEVPQDGFRCVEAAQLNRSETREMFLIESHPVGELRVVTLVRTLRKNSGLFLELAAVDLTPNGVKQFADKHGALGGSLTALVTLSKTSRHKQFYPGERLSGWYREIELLRRLLPLWNEQYKRKSKSITQFRTTATEIFAEWDTETEEGVENIASRSTSPELYEELKGKPHEIQRHYLTTKINAKLVEHASTPRLLYDRTRGRMALYFVPTSLTAAIWLQFASAVDGDRQYRTCKTCSRWFEIGGTGRRSDAETCSDSCRAAWPRIRMQRKGKSS